MRNINILMTLAVIALIALVIASMSFFSVDERERAIVLQLGQPVGDIQLPGLHLKIPLIQTVVRFDSRILSVDPPPAQMVISSSRDNPLIASAVGALAAAIAEPKPVVAPTSDAAADTAAEPSADTPPATTSTDDDAAAAPDPEMVSGEPIIVDTFARYRITDPLKFLKALGTVDNANQRIESIMNDATRGVLGHSTMRQLLSPERAQLMDDIKQTVNGKISTGQLGITIIDIRIVRADLTPELRQSTVTRMISKLRERATETRSRGEQSALEIRSTAEKERTVLLADAERDAKTSEGEGDRQAIAIYAAAYNKDKDFYDFTRSLEAYRNTLASPDTHIILSPDNALLKYFRTGPGEAK